MPDLPGFIGSAADLALVILGFGLLIVIHELGHFLAARWAGIRVLAFAVGMGPALVSWRKGLGLRRGSSEQEYMTITRAAAAGATTIEGTRTTHHALSPTEYRLNALPFGGYVKMLGQDDADPTAVSTAADSYQSCPVWKRMIVISAGVVANAAAAAVIFIFVFRVGLATEPPVIGDVLPGSAASTAEAINAPQLKVTRPGLRPGDRIVELDGARPDTFSDLTLATAMASRTDSIDLRVQRDGVPEPLHFLIKPKVGAPSGLLELGVEPPRSAKIFSARTASRRAVIEAQLERAGLPGVRAGMTLVRVGNERSVTRAEDLNRVVRESGGNPVELEFADDTGRATVTVRPRAELQHAIVPRAGGVIAYQPHLLGLTPVIRVADAAEKGGKQGLVDGDIFVRIGTLEYPNLTSGTAEIRAHAGRTLDVVVARAGPGGTVQQVPLTLSVDRKGAVGFYPGDTSDQSTLLSLPPVAAPDAPASSATPAQGVITSSGARVAAVDSLPVTNFTELRDRLRSATRAAFERADPEATVTLTLERPALPSGPRPDETVTLRIPRADLLALHALTWLSPVSPDAFELEQTELKAASTGEAFRMGVRETKRVMTSVYITFARLFEGTVKVEHLKGPVGITQLGTRIADRGYIWLLFFMGLISANLAVINFLPLPIVDGGQFLFLVAEAIRGRPVPMGIQNAATVAGLVLIGSMFLIVTFNDIVGLFGR